MSYHTSALPSQVVIYDIYEKIYLIISEIKSIQHFRPESDLSMGEERPYTTGTTTQTIGNYVYRRYNNTNYQKRKEDTSKVLVYNSYIYPTLERMRKLR